MSQRNLSFSEYPLKVSQIFKQITIKLVNFLIISLKFGNFQNTVLKLY